MQIPEEIATRLKNFLELWTFNVAPWAILLDGAVCDLQSEKQIAACIRRLPASTPWLVKHRGFMVVVEDEHRYEGSTGWGYYLKKPTLVKQIEL